MAKSENLKCPSCGKKLSLSKHYDATFEWFECPKCEGCFTYDEILEGGGDALEEEKENDAPLVDNGKKLIAKGKKRRTEIAEDEEALAKFEKEALKAVVKESGPKHRDEVRTGEIVNIMADELEEVYRACGVPLDRMNAEDKALNVVRHLRIKKVSFREKEIPHKLCKEHRG